MKLTLLGALVALSLCSCGNGDGGQSFDNGMAGLSNAIYTGAMVRQSFQPAPYVPNNVSCIGSGPFINCQRW